MKAEVVDGSICIVKGIKASATKAGIKENNLDVGLIYSEKPTVSAAVFTQNAIKAAPVVYDLELMKKIPDIRTVIVNSGNANACNSNGKAAIKNIVGELSRKLNIRQDQVFVASTGVIGEDLEYEKIINSMDSLIENLSEYGDQDFAKAITTTDTFEKRYALKCSFYETEFSIGGVAKGAGMIHPNMATMLAFLTTDINISNKMLNKALKEAVDKSFNRISVDGDTSTNDTVLIISTN